MKDYSYTQIANPVALKTSTLNYTDDTGANLTVRYHHEPVAALLALAVDTATSIFAFVRAGL